MVHTNVLKKFLEREESDQRIALFIEEEEIGIGQEELEPVLAEGLSQAELDEALQQFKGVLSEVPGKTAGPYPAI